MKKNINLIDKKVEYVKSVLSDDCTGHDWQHIYRVWQLSQQISACEGGDSLTIQLAALLHDIADWKFNNGDEKIGAITAGEWLKKQDASKNIIDEVVSIINDFSFKGAKVASPKLSLAGKIVQDADRLDALGAIGIARTFSYGGHVKRKLHDPAVPVKLHATFAEYVPKAVEF